MGDLFAFVAYELAGTIDMKIAVFGLGYVGLVTAVCYSSRGHEVVGIEADPHKLELLRQAVAPFREPGVGDLLRRAISERSLSLTDDAREAVVSTDLALICVGTPTSREGGTDLAAVLSVVRGVAGALGSEKKRYSVVVRSTVPPGTLRGHVDPVLQDVLRQRAESSVELFFYPEFLRQGTAVADFFDPPFVVVGTRDGQPPRATSTIRKLLPDSAADSIVLNYQEAELLKVACNAFHALKIDFANEIGTVAQHVDADPARVMSAFVSDRKLNVSAAYLRPGFAFGGSCLPKEVRSLKYMAETYGLKLPVIEAILPSNDAHLDRITNQVARHGGRTVGIVGLTFKANTDDLRESAAMRLIERLRKVGKDVVVYDPELQVDSLLGTNLGYLKEVLPDYVDRLVDWSAMSARAAVVIVTRAGLVTADELGRIGKPVIDLDRAVPIVAQPGTS